MFNKIFWDVINITSDVMAPSFVTVQCYSVRSSLAKLLTGPLYCRQHFFCGILIGPMIVPTPTQQSSRPESPRHYHL